MKPVSRDLSASVIQRLTWPVFRHEPVHRLYVNCANGVLNLSARHVEVLAGGYAGFDTYFNVFSMSKWFRLANVSDVGVRITLSTGRALARVCGIHPDYNYILAESHVSAGEPQTIWLQQSPEELKSCPLAFVELFCPEYTVVESVEWITTARATRDVRFAIVITTFNREAAVRDLVRILLADQQVQASAKIFVVNNGDPIDLASSEHLSVVRNPNLGGAGGFMRGLLEARDHGGFSHALFVDDDAVCPPVAIHRIKSLLDHSVDPGLCIGGAMLYLSSPWIQYECSARLGDFTPMPVNVDVDVRSRDALVQNDQVERGPYGPWWLFAFPITKQLRLAFPFFVRGDDVTFSLRNDLHPVFLNGVASWQESFDDKISPSVEYLAFRSFIMIGLVYSNPMRPRRRLTKEILRRIVSELCGYRYSIAAALCEGLVDVMAGPTFWQRNANMSARLAEVAAVAGPVRTVALEPRDATALPIRPDRPQARWYRWLRAVSLNGHLIPTRLCRPHTAFVTGMAARPARAPFRRRIAHVALASMKLYEFPKDNRLFFRTLWRALRLSVAFYRQCTAAREQYLAELPRFESEAFWREQFRPSEPSDCRRSA